MITLYRCVCGRYKRYGRGVYPKELEDSNERRLLKDVLQSGVCVILKWICPHCEVDAKGGAREDK